MARHTTNQRPARPHAIAAGLLACALAGCSPTAAAHPAGFGWPSPAWADEAQASQEAQAQDLPVISETPAEGGGDAGETEADGGGEDGGDAGDDAQDPDAAPSPAPTLVASRADMPALEAGQQGQVEITFTNTGDDTLVGGVASFSASAGLVLVGEASSYVLPDVPAHGTATLALTVQALDGADASAQALGVQTRFSYARDGALVEASAQDSVPVPCAAAPTDADGGDTGGAGVDDGGWDGGDYTYVDDWGGGAQQTQTAGTTSKPVPNVIVSSFSYGDGTGAVASGSEFPLTFAFTNTSASLAVDNLVVSVDTGDQFTINGGTNTFYFTNLGAGATQEQALNLKALASDKVQPGTVTISFKYEYVEGEERKTASTEVKLTVPVYQQDRFELAEPTLPEYATVGSESTVTLAYVNKGRASVANLAVSISGEGISTQSPRQNIGNIDAGKSGTIGFAFTPTQSGTLDLTLTVEYENANQDPVTKTFPVQVLVSEDPYANMTDEELAALYGQDDAYADSSDAGAQTGPAPWLVAACAAGGAAVAALVLALVLRRRAKKRHVAAMTATENDWDGWGVEVPPIPRGATAGQAPAATVAPAPTTGAGTTPPAPAAARGKHMRP